MSEEVIATICIYGRENNSIFPSLSCTTTIVHSSLCVGVFFLFFIQCSCVSIALQICLSIKLSLLNTIRKILNKQYNILYFTPYTVHVDLGFLCFVFVCVAGCGEK